MNFELPADFHIHTHHSGDSDAPMDMVIESAIRKNISAICITEHMDMDYPYYPEMEPDQFTLDTASYYEEFKIMKEKYHDRIKLCFGVELGMQPHLVKINSEYISKWPFDFVIGSNHIAHRKDPYYPSFYENRSVEEAYTDFFESTLENVKAFDDFDVLGHLDYIVRYAPGGESSYHFSEYKEVTDEILINLIKKGKGLDVNSKALYSSDHRFKNPNPCVDALKRYKELGGEIITLGSDAHKPEDIAGEFTLLIDILYSCGYRSYCTFEKRKPIFHDIPGV